MVTRRMEQVVVGGWVAEGRAVHTKAPAVGGQVEQIAATVEPIVEMETAADKVAVHRRAVAELKEKKAAVAGR